MNNRADAVARAIVKMMDGGEKPKSRARISDKVMNIISNNTRSAKLRSGYYCQVKNHLEDLGFAIIELEVGGYGIIRASSLNGAKCLTVTVHTDPPKVVK